MLQELATSITTNLTTTRMATVPVRLVLDDVPFYDGSSEKFETWLSALNYRSAVEQWTDDQKKAAAILNLRGTAANWNSIFGSVDQSWNDWITYFRREHVRDLTETEWKVLVKGRRQGLNEPIFQYVSDKLVLCKRHKVPLTEGLLQSLKLFLT